MHQTTGGLLPRGNDGGGGGVSLSRNTIIIISAVCGVVGLCILVLLWRLRARCRRRRLVPLPPVQDLAHRRERQLVALTERVNSRVPASWLSADVSGRTLSEAGSSVSLLAIPEKNSGVYVDTR